MKNKIICIFLTLLLIITSISLIGQANNLKNNRNTNSNNLTIEFIIIKLKSNPYTIKTSDNGKSKIIMKDFGSILVPGFPKLPSKTFNVGLPPGAEIISLNIISKDQQLISREYDIETANPFQFCVNKQFLENDVKIFNQDKQFPINIYEFIGMSQYNKFNIARIRFNPFSYIS
jgi:hypothetical protein